ncbi:MAG: hypothetical protein JWP27_853 [Flaviaesturariibacter sp.]|nr:hypothetical protein [Flaviaesturariibacter sp.]
MPSSIESTVSFSVVLAETFAAVGLATVVPTALIATAKLTKIALNKVLEKNANGVGYVNQPYSADTSISDNFKRPGGTDGIEGAVSKGLKALQAAVANVKDVNLLMPQQANIKADFTFSASDSYSLDVGGDATIQAVNVKAGYTALYASKSSNRISMNIHFETVAVTL